MTAPTSPSSRRPGARHLVLLVGIGLIGGAFSGALGVGGGVIIVPLLLSLLDLDPRRAAATSLAAIIPSSIAGSITYTVAGHTDLVAAMLIAAGGVAGTLVGTRLLRAVPLGWLRWGFIALLLLIAARMFVAFPLRGEQIDLGPATITGLVAIGIAIGIASGLFGIGGGVLIVPILIAVFGADDLVAKGTSLIAVVPISIVGSVANLRAHLVGLLDGIVIGIPAVAASLGGAAIAFAMPPMVSSIVFAAFVTAVAIQLSVRTIRRARAAKADEAP